MINKFYLFGCESIEAAEAESYFFPMWEAEPGPGASREEFISWEDRNPVFRFKEDLEIHMDSDFVELLDDPKYVLAQVTKDEERARLSLFALGDFSVFVMLGENAFHSGFPDEAVFSRSRYKLTFMGEYTYRS